MCLVNTNSDDDFQPPLKKKLIQSKSLDRFGFASIESEIGEKTKGYRPLIIKKTQIGL